MRSYSALSLLLVAAPALVAQAPDAPPAPVLAYIRAHQLYLPENSPAL